MSTPTALALALVLSIPLSRPALPVDVCGIEVVRSSILGYSVAGEVLSADEVAARIPLVDLVSALVAPMRRPLLESFRVVSDPLAGGFERVTVETLVLMHNAAPSDHRAVAQRVAAELRAEGFLACVDGFKVVVMAA